MIRRGSAALITAAAACAISGPAKASVPYDVYGCRLPDGSPASAEGWKSAGASALTPAGETCRDPSLAAELRAISARFAGPIAKGTSTSWALFAAPDTSIANFALWRAVTSTTGTGAAYWDLRTDASEPTAVRGLQECMEYQWGCRGLGTFATPLAPLNKVEFSGLHANEIDSILLCAGLNPAYPCDTPAEFRIYESRVGLLDEVAPILGAPKGTLVDTTQTLAGTRSLSFSATDRGGGIATVGLIVDGVEQVTQPSDPLSLRCRTPYTALVPCPLSVSVSIPLDTASLSDGSHQIAAFATDVSGNRRASAPVAVTTRNASFPNGDQASRTARLSLGVMTSKGRRVAHPLAYGSHAQLRGRLVSSADTPIAGARIELDVRSTRPGAASEARYATTGPDGRFVFGISPGPSRVISAGYRAFTLDAGYAATATTTIRVRAGATLSVSPRTLHNGHVVTFRGRLLGGPQRQDASIVLYAVAGRGRIPVTTLRASSSGHFSFRYRFRTVTSRSAFRFEVQVESRPSYPYSAGRSNRARVVVLP
jgi:hypothetical protein